MFDILYMSDFLNDGFFVGFGEFVEICEIVGFFYEEDVVIFV